MGWQGESQRHAMSSRGVKSSLRSTLVSKNLMVWEKEEKSKPLDGNFDNLYRIVFNLDGLEIRRKWQTKQLITKLARDKGCTIIANNIYCRSLTTGLDILETAKIGKLRSQTYQQFIPYNENRTVYIKINRKTEKPNSNKIWVVLRETGRRTV